ncbi:helix-turn-helix domain-containing protein [Tomitella biformata]|uniref:helix-turn-helix domain-containing protein n=1 Tax=Tomitella biformata TaxID=630403 RepID=UPI000464CA18|nr:helix-turn-helix domain-containing protein [Tomitella biformata]
MVNLGTAGSLSREQVSPPTARVVRVLDFLVRNQGQRFGLSELARRCEISKPTCLGIVLELTACGYLLRDPLTKEYGLGPALVAAGRAAQKDFALGPAVREGLERLSERFNAHCAAAGAMGDKIMMLEVITPPGASARASVGETYHFAPPLGLMLMLWQPADELDQWLRREPTLTSGLDLDGLRTMATECHSTGYLVENRSPVVERLHRLMASVASNDVPDEMRTVVADLVSSLGDHMFFGGAVRDRAESHNVSLIAAPTFDSDTRQSMVLTLNVGGEITTAELAQRGAALLEVAAEVTAEVGGRNPFAESG